MLPKSPLEPNGYPRATQGLPKGNPRDQHQTNTGALPEQHAGSKLAPRPSQARRHRAFRRGRVTGARPSSGAASTDCADEPDFVSAPWLSNTAAPEDGRTPPAPSPAGVGESRLHQIFRCRVIVFRLTARIPCVLTCRHENFISFAKTVHRKFSGCVVGYGRRNGMGPIQGERPSYWGV